jgi:hypothetical protein
MYLSATGINVMEATVRIPGLGARAWGLFHRGSQQWLYTHVDVGRANGTVIASWSTRTGEPSPWGRSG